MLCACHSTSFMMLRNDTDLSVHFILCGFFSLKNPLTHLTIFVSVFSCLHHKFSQRHCELIDFYFRAKTPNLRNTRKYEKIISSGIFLYTFYPLLLKSTSYSTCSAFNWWTGQIISAWVFTRDYESYSHLYNHTHTQKKKVLKLVRFQLSLTCSCSFCYALFPTTVNSPLVSVPFKFFSSNSWQWTVLLQENLQGQTETEHRFFAWGLNWQHAS